MNQAEFYKKLVGMVESGKEAEARKYLSEHILEFPLSVQDSILFAFFNEALQMDVKKSALETPTYDSESEFNAVDYLVKAHA